MYNVIVSGLRATAYSKDEIHPLKTSELDKIFEEIIEGTPISDTADTPITPTTSENILEEILRVDILFKIIDFGLSKKEEDRAPFSGTHPYMPVEKILGGRSTYKIDVWSVAMIMLELIGCKQIITIDNHYGSEKLNLLATVTHRLGLIPKTLYNGTNTNMFKFLTVTYCNGQKSKFLNSLVTYTRNYSAKDAINEALQKQAKD
uniref:Protein kinase domain-containing protein n=1 Tax=Panagrolaimus sp. ES5 TaxID=591445 RepID=A0AC34GD29_9BILA